MVTVNIPAALRPLAGGSTSADVTGTTLGEIIDSLEELYPGLQARLVDSERIRPGLAVFVNGAQVLPHLSTRVPDGAEIYFAPAIAGG